MGLLGDIRNKAQSSGKFLSTTGKGALQKVGDTARSIKKMGGQINQATGGAAGAAFEASKSVPGLGAVTTNIEKGLNMADKYSSLGVKAIELGEKASKTRDLKGAADVFKQAKGLAGQVRKR